MSRARIPVEADYATRSQRLVSDQQYKIGVRLMRLAPYIFLSAFIFLGSPALAQADEAWLEETDSWSVDADLAYVNTTLGGSGEVTGNVTVTDGGMISPGNSPGTLTVNGDLTVDGTTITIELGGLAPGTFDVLNVLGAVSVLNTPTVAFKFFGDYDENTAMKGDMFTFFTAESGLDSGPLAFDFSAVGGTEFWTTHVTGTSASVTYVPEPSSLVMLSVGAFGVTFRRRRS